MANMWRQCSFVVVAFAALAAVTACKGGGSPNAASSQPPLLSQDQVVNFAAELARSLVFAGRDCVSRGFTPNVFGTSLVNQSCTATRSCSIGGTIRPSMTATGQLFVSTTTASMNLTMGGSQNILNWGCVASNWIVSGNPTVSLTGAISVNSTSASATYRMTQSGQSIYGPPGGGQRSCAVSFDTLADANSGNSARIRGTICDKSFDRDIVL
jgi:hypothetical protein